MAHKYKWLSTSGRVLKISPLWTMLPDKPTHFVSAASGIPGGQDKTVWWLGACCLYLSIEMIQSLGAGAQDTSLSPTGWPQTPSFGSTPWTKQGLFFLGFASTSLFKREVIILRDSKFKLIHHFLFSWRIPIRWAEFTWAVPGVETYLAHLAWCFLTGHQNPSLYPCLEASTPSHFHMLTVFEGLVQGGN